MQRLKIGSIAWCRCLTSRSQSSVTDRSNPAVGDGPVPIDTQKHVSPGCDDAACEDAVCALDPFCCTASWGEICVTAARSFNRGLRVTYFALASVAWILGPVALLLGTGITFGVLYRREFASHSRLVLLSQPGDTDS